MYNILTSPQPISPITERRCARKRPHVFDDSLRGRGRKYRRHPLLQTHALPHRQGHGGPDASRVHLLDVAPRRAVQSIIINEITKPTRTWPTSARKPKISATIIIGQEIAKFPLDYDKISTRTSHTTSQDITSISNNGAKYQPAAHGEYQANKLHISDRALHNNHRASQYQPNK